MDAAGGGVGEDLGQELADVAAGAPAVAVGMLLAATGLAGEDRDRAGAGGADLEPSRCFTGRPPGQGPRPGASWTGSRVAVASLFAAPAQSAVGEDVRSVPADVDGIPRSGLAARPDFTDARTSHLRESPPGARARDSPNAVRSPPLCSSGCSDPQLSGAGTLRCRCMDVDRMTFLDLSYWTKDRTNSTKIVCQLKG